MWHHGRAISKIRALAVVCIRKGDLAERTCGHRQHTMRILQASIYDYPRYYELVYGSDWRAEYDFLCGSFRRYARCAVRTVFEPACGTGRLLLRLGKAGFRVSGLDLNPRAVEYCNRRLVRHGLPPSVWVGDMADLHLRRPVDAGMNLINSFRHLATESAAVRHLESMAASLRPGGVYVLGLHLTPTQGVPQDGERWSARRGHLAVTARLWTKRRDRRRRVEICGAAYDIHTPTRRMRSVRRHGVPHVHVASVSPSPSARARVRACRGP